MDEFEVGTYVVVVWYGGNYDDRKSYFTNNSALAERFLGDVLENGTATNDDGEFVEGLPAFNRVSIERRSESWPELDMHANNAISIDSIYGIFEDDPVYVVHVARVEKHSMSGADVDYYYSYSKQDAVDFTKRVAQYGIARKGDLMYTSLANGKLLGVHLSIETAEFLNEYICDPIA